MLQIFKQKYNGQNWEPGYEIAVESKILNFCMVLSKLWIKSSRVFKRFTENNSQWLKKEFLLPNTTPLPLSSNDKVVGRPLKHFSECSERIKRRKIIPLTKSYTSPELIYAARNKIQKSGKRCLAMLLKEATISPKRAVKIKNGYLNSLSIGTTPLTPDEALAFLLDNKLTKQQYKNIRKMAKCRNANIYPSYENILISKKHCYPDILNISETSCKIPLQSLLNHTTQRIFKIPHISLPQTNLIDFEVIYKWGCDGSSGQAKYKQTFSNTNTTEDGDIFMFSIVPLQLRCTINNEQKTILWKNPRTSSTRYCRPIKFEFKKETVENTLEEVGIIEDEIQNLIPTLVTINNIEIKVKNTLVFTMIDGKVCIKYNIIK